MSGTWNLPRDNGNSKRELPSLPYLCSTHCSTRDHSGWQYSGGRGDHNGYTLPRETRVDTGDASTPIKVLVNAEDLQSRYVVLADRSNDATHAADLRVQVQLRKNRPL